MYTTTGTKGFLEWLKDKQPRVYKAAMPKITSQVQRLGGLGLSVPGSDPVATSPSSSTSSTLASNLKDILMAASQAYLTREQMQAQEKLFNLQLSRAQQGLAPLDIDISKYGVPAPSVSVGIAGDTQKMLLWGAGIIAAILVLPRLLRRA
jgi:hypothetical protein